MIYVGRWPGPTLFLIDGSSQMYRAYHAFRGKGLSNQEGQTTHAVYVFVTMLRKLIADHKPAYHRRVVRPGRSDVPRRDRPRTTRPTASAMPDDLAEQINWVHQACEALGVPIVTAAGLRSRRRDRHAGEAGGGSTASTWRSCRSTRTSFSSCATASVSTIRAKTAPGSTTQGVVEKFGVKPSQVVGRAGAGRRHERQRRRRAGHREEGRDRSDHASSAASTRCSSTPAS